MPYKGVKLHGLVGPYKDRDRGVGKGGLIRGARTSQFLEQRKQIYFSQTLDQGLGLFF